MKERQVGRWCGGAEGGGAEGSKVLVVETDTNQHLDVIWVKWVHLGVIVGEVGAPGSDSG